MSADPCQFAESVDAYHDGELPPDRRERFEGHLAGCAACAADLRALRAISARLANVTLPAPPAGLIQRLHAAAPFRGGQGERGILRTAGALTAAAAAVLLFGLIGLSRTPRPADTRLAAWEQAAVTPQFESFEAELTQRQDPTRLIEWTSIEDVVDIAP